MKSYLFLLLAFTGLISGTTFAQDAYHTNLLNQLQTDYGLTGGSWVLTPNEVTNANNAVSYGNQTSLLTITGQDFTRVIKLDIAAAGNNPWDAGYFNPNVNSVQQGDRVLVALWLRANPGTSIPGKVTVFAENSTTFFKEYALAVDVQNTWTQYFIPFESTAGYGSGQLNFGFHLAYKQQTIEVGGIGIINYSQSVPFSALPQKFNNEFYPGSEPNAPWRAQAATRIEQYRKADMVIKVEDDQGVSVPNNNVRVEMLRHEFAFGTAVVTRRLAGNSLNDPVYQNHLLNLDGNGHGFNWVVNENSLKWRAWEQGWAGTPSETVKGIQWILDRDITFRGHVLVWPGWNFMPDDMMMNASDPAYLKNRINSRINTILNYNGVRDKVKEWDIINEIAHVRDLENALQGTPGYPTGREIYPEIFAKTWQEDSSLTTYINDYNILSNGSVTGGDYVLFKSFVQEIVNAGANLDGIGLQAHMGSNLVSPDSLYAILEDCYQTFGTHIKITEYDQSDVLSDSLAATYTGDFLTIIFSHPAVNGFIMWGFWDGAHWKNNAPLFNQNWTPKPALGVFNGLVFDQWWTDTTLMTDGDGNISLRGFKGKYRITTNYNGFDWTSELELGEGGVDTTLQLMLVGNEPDIFVPKVFVYPNPANDFVMVELPYPDQWKITLTNGLGKLVGEKTTSHLSVDIMVSDLPAGIYHMKISDSKRHQAIKKIIVR